MGGPSSSAREMSLRCVHLHFWFVRKNVESSLLLYAVIRCVGLLFLYRNVSADKIAINLSAPCVLYIGQAFRYSPENDFIYLINKYISLSDIFLTVHH